MDADLRAEPDLSCCECGTTITGTGYLLAARDDADAEYDPLPATAVCDDCGFNALGMTGCAPERDDLPEADAADALLYVRSTEAGLTVVSVRD